MSEFEQKISDARIAAMAVDPGIPVIRILANEVKLARQSIPNLTQQRDELLEALESLADNERYDDGDPRLEKARELARNAITKTKEAL